MNQTSNQTNSLVGKASIAKIEEFFTTNRNAFSKELLKEADLVLSMAKHSISVMETIIGQVAKEPPKKDGITTLAAAKADTKSLVAWNPGHSSGWGWPLVWWGGIVTEIVVEMSTAIITVKHPLGISQYIPAKHAIFNTDVVDAFIKYFANTTEDVYVVMDRDEFVYWGTAEMFNKRYKMITPPKN